MKLASAVACALWLVAANARAEEPAGDYTIPIQGTSGLVLPSGEGELCAVDGGDEICVTTDVATDVSGTVTGDGLVSLAGSVTAEMDLELLGRVSGSTLKPKLVLDVGAEGTASDGGIELDLLGSGKLKCKLVDEAVDVLGCRGKLKVCAFVGGQKVDCARIPLATQVPFVRQVFDINLDLVSGIDGGVTGDATVDVSDLVISTYTAKGRYKASADSLNLALKSVNAGDKTKLALKKVTLATGGASAGTVTFKVLGQKGRAELPSLAVARVPCGTAAPLSGWSCAAPLDTAALNLFLQSLGPGMPNVGGLDPYVPSFPPF